MLGRHILFSFLLGRSWVNFALVIMSRLILFSFHFLFYYLFSHYNYTVLWVKFWHISHFTHTIYLCLFYLRSLFINRIRWMIYLRYLILMILLHHILFLLHYVLYWFVLIPNLTIFLVMIYLLYLHHMLLLHY